MEERKTTKEKIIYESLSLFSKDGYNGVSMRDIAKAVGIKGASIYNHFKGKEEILNAIINEMTKRYDEAIDYSKIPSGNINEVADIYLLIDGQSLYVIAKKLFEFFVKDEFASQFRRMLVAQQYQNKRAKETLKYYFYDMPIQYQTKLFEIMITKNGFAMYNPSVMALHFYSPIFFLMNQYDINGDMEEILLQLKNHVNQFTRIYQPT